MPGENYTDVFSQVLRIARRTAATDAASGQNLTARHVGLTGGLYASQTLLGYTEEDGDFVPYFTLGGGGGGFGNSEFIP